jgi:hypothetical protein
MATQQDISTGHFCSRNKYVLECKNGKYQDLINRIWCLVVQNKFGYFSLLNKR